MPKRSTPLRFRRFAWLLAVGLLGVGDVSVAQQSSALSVELVDQRIAALRAGGTPSDNSTLTTYEQARGFLNDADSYAREAATYVESLTSAPQREAEIQRRLDAEVEEYDPTTELAGLATADELRARLAEAGAAQRDLQSRRDTLDRRLAGRPASATAIPARLGEIQQRLDALPEGSLTLDPAASPSLAEATQWRSAAEGSALETERRAREAELASQPARFSAMTAERAELALQLEQQTALIRAIDARLSDAAQTVAAPAALAIPATDPAYAVGMALAARVTELGTAVGTVNQRLAEVRAQNDEIARGSMELDERFAAARRIVEYGSSDALGTALLRYRAELESFVLSDPTERLPRDMGAAIIRNINYEETLEKLVSASGFVNQQLRDAGLQPESIDPDTRAALLDLVPVYRDRLRAAMTAESDYIAALGTLDTNYLAVTARLDEYRTFLEGRILWIPNRPPLWEAVAPGVLRAALQQFAATLGAIRIGPAWTSLLAVLAVLTLVAYRQRFVAVQQASNAAVGRPSEDAIGHSLRALTAAALRAAPIPLLLLGLAWAVDVNVPEGRSLRGLLYEVAFVLFTFSLMRVVSEPEGIGRMHFGWRPATMDRVHAQLTFLNRAWLPVAFVAALITRLAPFAEGATLARPLMVVATLMLTLYFASEQVREVRQAGGSWFTNTRHRLRALLVLVFLGLTVAVVYGQTFSVRVVTNCLVSSAYVGIFLLLAHGLLMRSLRIARWRVWLKEHEAARAAQPVPSEGSAAVQEPVADVGDVSAATAQLVNVATLFVAAAAALYIWEPLLPALAAFDGVELWTSSTLVDGETVVNRITLATVIKVLALAGLTLFAARRLPAVIEIVLRSRTEVSAGARYATSALLNYIIVGIGIVAALSALGLHWDQLQWLVAALGVGIGFGLQEIIANFISGIIILFERPIRVGDIVTMGDKEGTVTKIRIRATTIRDWDGKELLVPNKEFITGRLLNWTLSDTQNRIVVTVGIAYGSNVEQALKILNDVVCAHPRTLKEPAPLIVFENFGDNALELSARCFLGSPDYRVSVMTELRMTINRAFADAGITIAFPQRDVHLDTGGPIRVAIEAPAAEGRARPESLAKSLREA
jgi:potassium efflux system protein